MSSIVPYLTFRHGEHSIVHCELTRGDAVVMGGSGDVPTGAAPGLDLVVDEVPELFARLLDGGATEVYPSEQTEWGTWRARCTDPDGHEWTIGTYQPGQSW